MLVYIPASPYQSQSQYPFSSLFDGPRPISYLQPSCSRRSRRVAHQPKTSYRHQELSSLNDLFDNLMEIHHKPIVNTRLFNLVHSYQIKITKNNSKFHDYSINFRVNDEDEVELLVKSDSDSFEKIFSFRYQDINVGSIKYEINNNGMIIVVPKSHTSAEQERYRDSKRLSKLSNKSSHVCKPKPSRRASPELTVRSSSPLTQERVFQALDHAELCPNSKSDRTISIPITFEGSSVSEDERVSSDSEASADEPFELPFESFEDHSSDSDIHTSSEEEQHSDADLTSVTDSELDDSSSSELHIELASHSQSETASDSSDSSDALLDELDAHNNSDFAIDTCSGLSDSGSDSDIFTHLPRVHRRVSLEEIEEGF